MSQPVDPRELLRQSGLSPKKSWGQNFLVSRKVLTAIVEAMEAGPEDVIIEIGAGPGVLTQGLADTGARVLAVERDRDMITLLRANLGDRSNLTIVEMDAKKLDFHAVAADFPRRLKAAGNLPYHLTSPIIERLIEGRSHIERAVIMVQAEVAHRLMAPPGHPERSALGAAVELFARVHPVIAAPPHAFFPQPRVHSQVVRLDFTIQPAAPEPVENAARALIAAAFQQRRKTIRNSLKTLFGGGAPRFGVLPAGLQEQNSAAAIESWFALTGVDGNRRAETLHRAEWLSLAKVVCEAPPPVPHE
ncbi:MAG: Ribosomal RNA small subunit methyltransferase A [Myxococcota bacterium]|nr:Ribosomal RNA small subunit methyltransferase A [Myxococcota bacterium]